MEPKYLIILVVVIVVILYFVGGIFSENCSTIGNMKACWKTVPVTVTSQFCPTDEPCIASPEAQQNNAIVGLVLDACAVSKANGYSDRTISDRIKEVVRDFAGYDLNAQEICDQPGYILAYRGYG